MLAVEIEQIEEEEDQRGRVTAVRSEPDDVEPVMPSGPTPHNFAVKIGLAGAEGHNGVACWSYGDLRAAGNRQRRGRGDRQIGSTTG